jgi:hypothetical protein
MANENYQNVNDQMQGQPAEQQRDTNKSKPHNMLDALTYSMDAARITRTRAFKEIRSEHPNFDTGNALRRYHLAVLDAIKSKPLESFNVVFGLLGLAIFDCLTAEDKEALRNDSLD